MRRFLCLLLLWGAAVAPLAAAEPGPVLVMGDSLSAAHNIPVAKGWVHLLDERLADMRPPRRLVNASISGETSLSGRHRLPALLEQYQPSVLVLELGANDGLRGLPLDRLRINLETMVDAAQKNGVRVLLLGIELPVNYGPRYRDGLRSIYADLAAKHHTGLLPFLLEGVALDPSLMQEDGLHPTVAGQRRVADNVWKPLSALLD